MFKVIFISLYSFSNKDSENIYCNILNWKVTAESNICKNKVKCKWFTVINN